MEFTLADLAAHTGINPRTVRSYIEQGLLRGPEIGGRGARYTRYHLDRLYAIQVLKDRRGLPLAEVRQQLLTLSGEQIAALAQEAAAGPPLVESSSSALQYLQAVQARLAPAPVLSLDSRQTGPTPVDQLLGRLEQAAAPAKLSRKARGEPWFHIAVTPDVEIRVRGGQSADQLARWERIADHLRHLLLGGTKEQ